jgi:VIT1/CCC1 family predicted Fe2+/Mn2+ transporter
MMHFELGLKTFDPKRAHQSTLTIAMSYIAGGLIPLTPSILQKELYEVFMISVGVTLIALFLFGVFKGRFIGLNPFKSSRQTALVGGFSAAVPFVLARLIG